MIRRPEHRFEDLVDLDRLRAMMEHFHAATGIPAGLLGRDHEVLVAVGWQRICTEYHRADPEAYQKCRESDAFIRALGKTGACVEYQCDHGLRDVATPITVDGEHLATLSLGQFLYADDRVDPAAFAARATRYGFDERGYLESLDAVPRYDRDRVRQIMGFLTEFAGLLMELAATRASALRANRALEAKVAARTRELEESRARIRLEQERLFSLLDGLPAYVYLQAPDYSVRYANRYFRERFGEDLTRSCHDILWGRDEPCETCPTFKVFADRQPRHWEWDAAPDGRTYQVYDYPFSDTDGQQLVLEMGIDITERKRLESQLHTLAMVDDLTRLPNRRHLVDLLQRELERARRKGTRVGLLMIDIDHFKRVNDVHGHALGDLVLRTVAQRMDQALRNMDTLGRLGGEEFLAILPETEAATVERIAERIRSAVESLEIETPRGALSTTVSIGTSSTGAVDGTDGEALLEQVDRAMYRAKRGGRNRIAAFEPPGGTDPRPPTSRRAAS